MYDPSLRAYVSYSVPSSTAAPANLTFGPSFIKLAGTYPGQITMGLNRGHDNLSNTIEAAKVVVENIHSLKAIELGNEPDRKSMCFCHQESPILISYAEYTSLPWQRTGNRNQSRTMDPSA